MSEVYSISNKTKKIAGKINLINTQKFSLDEKLYHWIKILGESSSTDRVFVYFFSKDEQGYVLANNTHEWCRKGISSVKDDQQNIPIDLFPAHKEILYNQQKIVVIKSKDDLTEDAKSLKELMDFQGLRSILAVPIISDSVSIGFLGFETIKKEENWSEKDLYLLKHVSRLIGLSI